MVPPEPSGAPPGPQALAEAVARLGGGLRPLAAGLPTAAAREELEQQLDEAAASAAELARLAALQTALAGQDPLGPDAPRALSPALDEPAARRPAAPGAGGGRPLGGDSDDSASSDDSDAGERDDEAAQRLLVGVFALVDALDRPQVSGLAAAVRCSAPRVRAVFSELRARLRTYSAAAARRASKAVEQDAGGAPGAPGAPGLPPPPDSAAAGAQPGGSGLGPTCLAAAAAITAQKQALARVVDPTTGAITNGGRFLGLLGSLSSWLARSGALAALAASYGAAAAPGGAHGRAAPAASAAVRGQLTSSRLLDVLEAWLAEARKDRQVTMALQLLAVLAVLSPSPAMLAGTTISREVEDLASQPHARLAAAAAAVTRAWDEARSGGVGERYAAPGGTLALGGGVKLSATYKRRVTLAVKRTVEELQLTGDIRHVRPARTELAARAALGGAAAAGSSGAGAAAIGAATVGAAAVGAAHKPAAVAGSPAAAAAAGTGGSGRPVGSSLRRPIKRAGGGPAAGGAAAASAAKRQATQSEAAARLASLHALSRGGAAAGTQRQAAADQAAAPAALPPAQRLIAMAPHGRAPAAFLAAAGALGPDVTQAVQAYDRAVQQWLAARVGAAAREAAAAEEAMARIAEAAPSPAVDWAAPPPLPPDALRDVAAGEDSELAKRPQQQLGPPSGAGQDSGGSPLEPAEPAGPAAAGPAPPARRVPLHPTDPREEVRERVTLWRAGIRLPSHVVRPPTSTDVARVQQEQQQAQQELHQAQQQPTFYQPAPAQQPATQAYYLQQPQGFVLQPAPQQVPQLVLQPLGAPAYQLPPGQQQGHLPEYHQPPQHQQPQVVYVLPGAHAPPHGYYPQGY
ncbi:hypothetical protein HT031_006683 [Scenedesmus sp. PABB004]|nr:hypothetical protein HT031_006683 [Scenedesmus sp. PABB004]